MQAILRDSCLSYTMIRKWAAEFKRGRESIVDDPRSGRPPTATNQRNVVKICDMIMGDRSVKSKRDS